ncbi:hypothetical protein CLOACE_12420 [Clostridium acetireducens DSM 10703]|uniref:Uncharacterized protein n=1 Tax=Clostridium acetireducens DSM 10703 TaxID=1121290 RepID=A0A1E8EZ03_9CLOT|nr:hypothetical protein [Clostridium acetireducens]OFI06099.1 hypothetical protein CLOACE_12420 [Clostridium acetireducens DSM 10703]
MSKKIKCYPSKPCNPCGDPCTLILFLLILGYSGLINNNNALILIFLYWLCCGERKGINTCCC